MRRLDIFINGTHAQLSDELKITLDKVVSEFRNPLKKTGAYSYTVKFPLTQTNKQIFDFQNERQAIGKFRKNYRCEVLVDGITVLEGVFVLNKISKGFEGFISGSNGRRIADIIDETKKLRDIASFTPIKFEGDKTVWEYLDRDLLAENSEVAFPFLVDSFARLKNMNGGLIDGTQYHLSYENFGLSHFISAVFRNIFADAGYTLEGEILDTEEFRRALLLYSDNGLPAAYNYGRLNPFRAYTQWKNIGFTQVAEGEDFNLLAMSPSFESLTVNGTTYGKTGDLSFSQGEYVYTAKHTGDYTISYQFEVSPTLGRTDKILVVFREITNSEFVEPKLIGATMDTFNINDIVDYDCLSVAREAPGEGRILRVWVDTKTVRLKEDGQYQIQVYLAVPKAVPNYHRSRLANYAGRNLFHITTVDARTEINPAHFLPDMGQLEFVQAMFKMFNLYYDIDEEQGKILLFTRDEWFELNRSNVTDLTHNLNLDVFEETPLTEADTAETYYKWSGDESDHLLAHTDYMDTVNAEVTEEVYELPFAPLGFLKVPVLKYQNGVQTASGFDLVPAAIPATDSVDATVLYDFEASANFSYKPKIALYYGAGYLAAGDYRLNGPQGEGPYYLRFSRTPNLPGGFTVDGLPAKHLPKLAFFNTAGQPTYGIEVVPATREFRLNQSTGGNIYDPTDTAFLVSADKAKELDTGSLGMQGSKSLFRKLYTNDLLITEWSNYYEGTVKINPVLYENLNGRNIIRVENELFLLESIKNYELSGNTAKIKLYQLVSG